MANWEIVVGDYGRVYRANIEDVDLSDCTAAISVWNPKTNTTIIDAKACSAPVFDDPDSHVDFTPISGDFDVEPFVYKALITFTKTGVVERTIPFTWEVFEGEP